MRIIGDIIVILGVFGLINPQWVLSRLGKSFYKGNYEVTSKKLNIVRGIAILWVIIGVLIMLKG